MLERIHQIPTVFGVNPLELCTEDTLLYHIISGLHSSVNMHISANYYDMESNRTYANHSMFYEKLGKYPDRIAKVTIGQNKPSFNTFEISIMYPHRTSLLD